MPEVKRYQRANAVLDRAKSRGQCAAEYSWHNAYTLGDVEILWGADGRPVSIIHNGTSYKCVEE